MKNFLIYSLSITTVFINSLKIAHSSAYNTPKASTLIDDSIEKKGMRDILELVPRNQIGASLKILKPVFESKRRGIKNQHKYGQSFPCNPEILCDLMSQAKGKQVLEIAGASGENALLMGLAGAKHVYMNDIV